MQKFPGWGLNSYQGSNWSRCSDNTGSSLTHCATELPDNSVFLTSSSDPFTSDHLFCKVWGGCVCVCGGEIENFLHHRGQQKDVREVKLAVCFTVLLLYQLV